MAVSLEIGGGITFEGGISITPESGIVLLGLQLYLDAIDPASYSGTGTTWYDLSGNANDVDMQNDGSISYNPNDGAYFTLSDTG